MAGQDNFGVTTVKRDGVIWSAHSWPLTIWKERFSGLSPADVDDWKAIIYAHGGPLPSKVSRIDFSFDPVSLCALVLFLEKSRDPEITKGAVVANPDKAVGAAGGIQEVPAVRSAEDRSAGDSASDDAPWRKL